MTGVQLRVADCWSATWYVVKLNKSIGSIPLKTRYNRVQCSARSELPDHTPRVAGSLRRTSRCALTGAAVLACIISTVSMHSVQVIEGRASSAYELCCPQGCARPRYRSKICHQIPQWPRLCAHTCIIAPSGGPDIFRENAEALLVDLLTKLPSMNPR